ncbi:hypothetical protein J8J27_34050, partial [Mycobacterium tuberculosis]|nr:hypothetical protein [Mycobacterium tuberculosis]
MVDDVPAGADARRAEAAVRLLGLIADLDGGTPGSPVVAATLSPVLVTPDECGPAYADGRLNVTLQLTHGAGA